MRSALQLSGRTAGNAATPRLALSIPCAAPSATYVASPNPTSGRNILAGLAAIAPNDVWASGFYVNGSSVYQTLAEHWDGSAWGIVTTPNVGPGNNLLTAVTAIGPGDVWAVGYFRPGTSGPAQPLTEHWNGNGWTVVPTPVPPSSSTYLYAVGSDASGDVWAVGISVDLPVTSIGPRAHPFALQWNGNASSWSMIAPATPRNQAGPMDVSSLNGVKVLAGNDVWVVGDAQDYTGSTPSSPDTSFIEHWDGFTWSLVTAPVHANGDFLSDVQGIAGDLWAVGGQSQTFMGASDNVVIEHWNGSAWTDSPGLSPEQGANLFAVGYLTGNNVYAVGASAYSNSGTNLESDHTLIERWDGTRWTLVMSFNPSTNDAFYAVAAISASDLWAAGRMTVNGYAQTLTENVCALPVVTKIAPSSGNPGSTVVITGSGFSRAIDVEFGATPAFTFHVDSDTQITAVSPGHKAGMVDITVTVQGTSAMSSADQFTYQGSISVAPPGSGTFQNRMSPPPPVRGLPLRPGSLTRAEVVPRAAPSTVSLVPGSPNGDLLSRVAIGVAVTMLELML
jgi:hypothetical protein